MVVEPGRFAPAFSKARFKLKYICSLILYVALTLGLIAAHILGFYVILQQLTDFGRKSGQFARQSLQIGAQKIARIAARERRIAQVEAFPVAWNALLYAGRDHLGDVAPRQRDLFAQQRHRRFSARTSSARFSISAARATSGMRSKPKASSIGPPALSWRSVCRSGVAPDDQPSVDEASEMPSQRRRRHAMGADRELLVRGEHDDAGAGQISFACLFACRQSQRRLLMEAKSACSTDSARSVTPSGSLASVSARYSRHLCTTVSDAPGLAAKFSVAAWLATMASDSGRRPKGVVGCVCMILCLVQAKRKRSPNRRTNIDK